MKNLTESVYSFVAFRLFLLKVRASVDSELGTETVGCGKVANGLDESVGSVVARVCES